jgi:hypothetical protein
MWQSKSNFYFILFYYYYTNADPRDTLILIEIEYSQLVATAIKLLVSVIALSYSPYEQYEDLVLTIIKPDFPNTIKRFNAVQPHIKNRSRWSKFGSVGKGNAKSKSRRMHNLLSTEHLLTT